MARARWALRRFEEKAANDDCYAATASLVAVRSILFWMFMIRARIHDVTLCLGHVKGAFLHALMKDGEVFLAQPPPEWRPSQLNGEFNKVIWKLQKALRGLRT